METQKLNKQLKRAIVNYMFDNAAEFQLINTTTDKFRQYIYTEQGEYCFGGEQVSKFIGDVGRLVNNY